MKNKSKSNNISLDDTFCIKAFYERLLTHQVIVYECLKATLKAETNISERQKSFKREIFKRYYIYIERKR